MEYNFNCCLEVSSKRDSFQQNFESTSAYFKNGIDRLANLMVGELDSLNKTAKETFGGDEQNYPLLCMTMRLRVHNSFVSDTDIEAVHSHHFRLFNHNSLRAAFLAVRFPTLERIRDQIASIASRKGE